MKSLEQITADMLRDQGTWPLVTHLCVKKPSERPDGVFPKCGLIRANGYGTDRIVIENHPDRLHGEFTERFDSLDAALAAGWIVD